MSVLSNPARASVRAKLLIGAGAAALTLAMGLAGPAAAGGPLPVAAPGNWSGVSAPTTLGTTETVVVSSNRAYAEWSTFNIGGGNTFKVSGQTSPNWILVNKVTNSVTGSTISGNINADGQVWILDPNGVTVNAGASLNVGGLLLSSASWSAADKTNFLAGGTSWSFTGQASPIVMNGTVTASGGGVVALLGPSVTVGGAVNTGANTQFLAVAAKDVSLSFDDSGTYFTLSGVSIDRGADGGGVTIGNGASVSADRIVVAAAGATSAASIVVSGGLTANAARGDGTDIVLMAADGTGPDATPTSQTILSGGAVATISSPTVLSTVTLSSTGSLTGSGVTLSSAGDIDLAGNISATTATLNSAGGAVDQTEGVISATTLTGSSNGATSLTDANLVGTVSNYTAGGDFSLSNAQSLTATSVASTGGNVTLQTTAGDINVTGALATGSGDTLTLDSYHSISISSALTVPGAGQVVLTTNDGGVGGDYDFGLTSTGFSGSLSFTGGAGSGAGLTINGQAYSLLYSMSDLAALNTATGHYALALSLDASGTTYTDAVVPTFGGTVTGLGHTVSNLTINSSSGNDVGLFGDATSATLRDIGVVGGAVTGRSLNSATIATGLLVGTLSAGTVVDSYSTGHTAETGNNTYDTVYAGGLIGGAVNGSSVSNVFSTASVTSQDAGGGLIGALDSSTLSNAHASGAVSGPGDAGGLVGWSNGSTITQVWATGTASGHFAGGLIGESGLNNSDTISNVYATGAVSGGGDTGGLIGELYSSSLSNAYATGAVTSNFTAGGLVGGASGPTIINTYATGSVNAVSYAGGLVGFANFVTISNSYAIGRTTDAGSTVGADALIGETGAQTSFSNLYYNSDTAGAASAFGTGLTTAQLQGALPTGFGAAWARGTGLYPYLVSFWSSTPQAISGTAYNSDASVAAGATVGVYVGGVLQAQGLASTGANGAYYELVAGGTVGASTPVGTTVTLSGASTPSGLSFTDQPSLANGNVTLTGVTSGATAETTSQANLSGLTTGLGSAFGSAYATITSQLAGTPTTITGTSGSGFTVDQALSTSGGLTLAASNGALYLDANVSAGGNLTLANAVVLQADTTLTGATVKATSTIDGAHALTISGNAEFDAAVGGGTSLSSLSVSGTTALDGGAVTTTGTQTYTGAATLGADTTLTGSTVGFGSTLDGAYGLTITGNASFGGAVGGGTSLTSLDVSGTTALGAPITTTGAQTYGGAVTLTADSTLTASKVTTQSTVDGAHALSISGDAEFDAAVGGGTSLSSLSVSGTTALDGGAVTTTGAQTYTGAATLGAATTLTGSTVGFGSTLDGAYGLTTTGNAEFDAAVGGATSLASLSVSGTSLLDGGSVTTTGTQTYTGAATLGADTTLTGSTVGFGSTLNGAHGLTITGNASFGGAVGGGTSLTSLGVSGTTALGASITTTGTQTYTGAVTLTAGSTLTASKVTTDSTVDGAYGLTITGDAEFDAAVGGGTKLSSLSVSGTSLLSGGSVSTTGTQAYAGAVTLGADTTLTASKVTATSTVDGAHGLAIDGNAEFDAAVGGGTHLTSLSVSGTSLLDAGAVTTTGTQTYTGAATLGAATTLTGSTVGFGSTLNGAYGLTVTGNASFSGVVGGVTSLSGLSVSGTTSLDGGAVTTTGAQTYSGAATLGADTTLTGSSVGFGSTLDGAYGLTITGAASFGGRVGGGASLASLDVSGATALGASITTTGVQTYGGAVTLTADSDLTASKVTTQSTVDGAHALTVSGDAEFDAAVGGGTSLSSLGVSGTTALGGSITTTGTQTYTGAVTLTADSTLTASKVTTASTVDGAYGLSISGNAEFDAAVGGGASLASLSVSGTSLLNGGSVTTTGTQDYGGAVTTGAATTLTGSTVTIGAGANGAYALAIDGNASFAGVTGGTTRLTQLDVSGATTLAGATIQTSGHQTYTGAVGLTGASTLSTQGAAIDFASTVNGGWGLSANAAAGGVIFGGVVGGTTALASLHATGGDISLPSAVTTSGAQTYSGPTALVATTTLTGSLVTAGSTLDGAHALTVTGNAAIDGVVGGGTALTSLSVSGTTAFDGGAVITTGAQTYSGAVTLSATTQLTGSLVTIGSSLNGAYGLTITGNSSFGGVVGGSAAPLSLSVSGATTLNGASITTVGAQTYSGAVTLGGTSSLSTQGGAVDFASTINGGFGLTVDTDPSIVTFSGAVGAVTPLASLSVTGSQIILPVSVNTTGAQTYTGPVTLAVDTTLTGSQITATSTIDGAYSLAIVGAAEFDGAVGGATALTSLSVSGATLLNGGAVITTGTQTYTGAATLGVGETLTGSTVGFGGTLDGANTLAVVGNASFGGAVGATTPLAWIAVSGTTALNGGTVATQGNQTYSGAVTLGADATLTGASIIASSTINGAHALTIDGGAEFDGAIGGATALSSLGVNGSTLLNAGAVTTTGTQTYSGQVILGADTTLTGSKITTGWTVDGAYRLTVDGNAEFDATIGGGTDLTSLSVSGTTALIGGAVTTTGTQTYTGALILGRDTTLTGSTITAGATVDGGYGLTVAGNAVFDGAVGGGTALTSLGVSGTAALDGGAVATTGNQTYTGAVTLGANTTLTGATITAASTVDGGYGLTISGNAGFDGAVGGSTSLASLSVSGATELNGGSVSTTGTQTYTGAVTLGATTTLTGATITAGSTVDGGYGLAISGNAALDGGVGGVTHLASLSVSGTTALNGGSVTTTGTQTYTGAVTLGASNTLTGSTITADSTVDGGYGLAISGAAVLDGAVGGVTHLASLSVSGPTALNGGAVSTNGTQTYTGAVTLGADTTLTGSTIIAASTVDGGYALAITGNAEFDARVGSVTPLSSLSVSGATLLDGVGVTTTGTQTYGGAVTLGADALLTGSLVTVASSLDGAHGLIIVGDASFSGVVGGTAPPSSLGVSGATALHGASITTVGQQVYSGAVTLSGTSSISTQGATVDFVSTINGGYGLTVDTDSSPVIFAGAVGAVTPLASLSVTSSQIYLPNIVNTTGAQTYTGPVTLVFDTTLTGSKITATSTLDGAHGLTIAGDAELDGAVGGGTALASLSVSGTTALNGESVATTGAQTYTGAVSLGASTTLAGSTVGFGTTVDGAQALSIEGNASFGGAVGAGTRLTSLFVSGATTLDGGAVTTTGPQAYAGAVTLGAATTLTGSNITLGGAVDGAYSLTVTGNAEFDGAIGGGTPLASLSVSGTSLLKYSGSVTTSGTQTYSGPVTLDVNTSLIGSTVSFASTVDGDYGLTVVGNASLGGAVGATTSLASLDITGTTVLNGGSVATVGQQTYGGAATLGAATTLTGSNVVFGAALDGPYSLSIDAGAQVVFNAAVGGNTPLASLAVTGGSISVDAPITTTGALSLTTTAADLTLSHALTSGSGGVTLDVTGNLALKADISAGAATASFTATGWIDQSAGVITAGALTGSSGGSSGTSLADANLIGTLGAFTTYGTGADFTLTNAQALTVNGAVTAGATAGGGPVGAAEGNLNLTTTSGPLTLAGNLTATRNTAGTAGGTVTLVSAGTLSQTGGLITGPVLQGSSVGSATLDQQNLIGTLASFANGGSGNFSLTDAIASGLTLGSALNMGAGSISLTSSHAGTALSFGVNLSTDAAHQVDLASAGAITQTGGVITSGTLTGSAATSATMNDANAVSLLTGFTATTGLAFTNAGAFSASNIAGGAATSLTAQTGALTLTGPISGGATTLTATTGAIVEQSGGAVTASTLAGLAGTSATLNQANDVGALTGFMATTGLSFTNAVGVSATGVNGGSATTLTATTGNIVLTGAIGGTTTTLTSTAGAISQTGGVITATTLTGSAATTATLDDANQVGTLSAFTAPGGLSFVNAQAFSATGVNGGTSTSLTASAGDLTLSGNIIGAATTLTSTAGAITQANSGSVITATTLTGSAGTSATLNGPNAVGTLSNFTASTGLSYTSAAGFTATGVDGGTTTSLTATSGDLALSGLVGKTATGSPASGATTLVSTTGNIFAPGGGSQVFGQDIVATAQLDANLGALTASRDVAITSTTGAVSIVSATAGGNIYVNAIKAATTGALTASPGTSSGGPASLAALNAGLTSTALSGGQIAIAASNVTFTSAVKATDVLLFAQPGSDGGTVYIGANTSAPVGSFQLTQTDFNNVSAGSLNIFAGVKSGAVQGVTIGDLDFTQSHVPTLRVYSNAEVDVLGAVTGDGTSTLVIGAYSTNFVGDTTSAAVAPGFLTSGWTPSTITVQGSIGAGTSLGRVDLAADNIYIAPAAEFASFKAAVTGLTPQRPETLPAYTGKVTTQVGAGVLELRASTSILQRNLATLSTNLVDGVGLNVGTLKIGSVSAANQTLSQVSLFGTLRPATTQLTGLAAALSLTFSATGSTTATVQFQPTAAILVGYRFNTCVFGGGDCYIVSTPFVVPPLPNPDQIGDLADPYAPIDEEPVTNGGGEVDWSAPGKKDKTQ